MARARPAQPRVRPAASAKTLIPARHALGCRALAEGARLVSALPAGISRAIAKLNNKGFRLHDSMPVKDYSLNVSCPAARASAR